MFPDAPALKTSGKPRASGALPSLSTIRHRTTAGPGDESLSRLEKITSAPARSGDIVACSEHDGASTPEQRVDMLLRQTDDSRFFALLLGIGLAELVPALRTWLARGNSPSPRWVFGLLAGAGGESGRNYLGLMELLKPAAMAAFAAHERDRSAEAGTISDDGVLRRAAGRTIEHLTSLGRRDARDWCNACAPVISRASWTAGLRTRSNIPNACKSLRSMLSGCFAYRGQDFSELMLHSLATSLESAAERRGSSREIDPQKLLRMVLTLPSTPGGNALLKRLLALSQHGCDGQALLQPRQRDADLEELAMTLCEVRAHLPGKWRDLPPAPRSGEPPGGHWSGQQGGLRVAYADILPVQVLQNFARRLMRLFAERQYEDALQVFIDSGDTRRRQAFQAIAGAWDLAVLRDEPDSLIYVRRAELARFGMSLKRNAATDESDDSRGDATRRHKRFSPR